MTIIYVRIDEDLKNYLNRNNYPTLEIVRASLLAFVKMEFDEKVNLLVNNKENFKDINSWVTDTNWEEQVNLRLKELFPDEIIKKIYDTGIELDILDIYKNFQRD